MLFKRKTIKWSEYTLYAKKLFMRQRTTIGLLNKVVFFEWERERQREKEKKKEREREREIERERKKERDHAGKLLMFGYGTFVENIYGFFDSFIPAITFSTFCSFLFKTILLC